MDRVADAIVLLPAAMGAFVLVCDIAEYRTIDRDSLGVFGILACLSAAPHVWFGAEAGRGPTASAAARR